MLTTVVAAFALALIAATLLFGVGIVGVPVALVALAVTAVVDFRRRRTQAGPFAAEAGHASDPDVDFTPRDRETLVPDPPESSRGARRRDGE